MPSWLVVLLDRNLGHLCDRRDPIVDRLRNAPVVDHPHHVDERPDVDPQVGGALHVVADARVLAVRDRLPLLLRAHPVDEGHGAQNPDALQQSGEDELQLQLFMGQLDAAAFPVRVNETLEHAVNVLAQEVVLATIQPPPELGAHGVGSHAAPIQHARVETPLGVAPEEHVVHVEAAVGPGNVVRVAVAPPPGLRLVGIDLPHHGLVHANEVGRSAVRWK
mmetsp:Transcript_87958/g.272406  ORF Transcript_87958/g.272406 Transcript_87958/m.272406 type:complete len:220 (+) Transcript_87958:102-761(+)